MTPRDSLHVPFSYQSEAFNCGPHTLRLVMQFLGNDVDESKLREYGKTTIEEGTSCENMTRAARLAHFWAYGKYDGKLEDLEHYFKLGYPAIVHLFNPEWPEFGYGDFDRSHYVIVTGVYGRRRGGEARGRGSRAAEPRSSKTASVYDSYVTVHDPEPPDPAHPSGPHMRLKVDEFLRLWSGSEGRGEKNWFLILAKNQLDERFVGPTAHP